MVGSYMKDRIMSYSNCTLIITEEKVKVTFRCHVHTHHFDVVFSCKILDFSHPLQSVEGVGGGDGGAEECEDELGAVLEEE